MEVFIELSIIISLATVISIVMKALKQPLIVGYILTGIAVGPHIFNLLHSKEYVELFSRIGIMILLFIVGLSLNPRIIRDVGKPALIIGIGQILITFLFGYSIALLLGIAMIPAIFIAIALTFSSTIIILKLLSDKEELNKLYGKISIGVLLIQDLAVLLILLVISSFTGVKESNPLMLTGLILLKGIFIISALALISKYLLPKLSHFIASSQELLFIFSIMWGMAWSSIFYFSGFSIEIGALIAGVSFSGSHYADTIASRMKPLRDFFILLFFILLGTEMRLDTVTSVVLPAVIFSLFVLIGKPVIVFIIMNLMGFKEKTAFHAGTTVAQISEFSLILITLLYNINLIDKELLSLVTLVAIITITISTYFILYSKPIYEVLKKYLRYLELRKIKSEMENTDESYDIILFGFDRVGHDFCDVFLKMKSKFLVVDYNPELIPEIRKRNVPFKFGDAEDIEFLKELNLRRVKMVISTIPSINTSKILVKKIRSVNSTAIVILLSHDIQSAIKLYQLGASYVIMPHYLGAKHASDMIARLNFNFEKYIEEKEKHMGELEKPYFPSSSKKSSKN